MTWCVLHIFCIGAFLCGCWILIRSGLWEKKWFWLLVICIGIGARLVFALTVRTPIRWDQEVCLDAAQRLVQGDTSWANDFYFQRWAYQIPFVLYEAFLLKIFGSVSALYVVNALESIAICVLLYFITLELVNNRVISLMVAAMFVISPSYIMHEGLLYNNIPGALIWLIALYLFVLTKKKSFLPGYLLCGVVLGLSQAIRSEAIIWLLAIICFQIYELLSEPVFSKRGMAAVLEALLVIAGFYLTLSIISAWVKLSGLSSWGISNNTPYWWIVCGFSPENYGEYSVQYAHIASIVDPEKHKAEFISIMKEILGGWNVKTFTTFWVGKLYRMWGADNGPWAYGLDSSTFMQLMLFLDKAIYLATIVLSFVGIKTERTSKQKTLMIIAFLGFFCVFILKEISVKYRYNPTLCLLLLSAFGISKLMGKSKTA